MAVHDYGALTAKLKCVCNLVLLMARRIRDEPNSIESGVPKRFRFNGDYVSSSDRGKFHHHMPGRLSKYLICLYKWEMGWRCLAFSGLPVGYNCVLSHAELLRAGNLL